MKRTYGETKNEILILKSKTRMHPENNIFTEKITFDNGLILIIEERVFVKKVILPDKTTIIIDNYYYNNCN